MSLGLTLLAGWCALDVVVVATYLGLHRWSTARRSAGPSDRALLAAGART
ncbi:hypothetical protein [Patulibacter sp.]|nr:hypothetical protein [Patulibacter sp.]MDO9407877.1 hypothetical protein [Patulibacter sp.]